MNSCCSDTERTHWRRRGLVVTIVRLPHVREQMVERRGAKATERAVRGRSAGLVEARGRRVTGFALLNGGRSGSCRGCGWRRLLVVSGDRGRRWEACRCHAMQCGPRSRWSRWSDFSRKNAD
uniref:Uncharacterized protein n=1 Tax=Hyaloperonospora arabidopsidis (strain Emoy2) TaxID=559515 RepID=M4BJB2_HYAAE